MIFPQELFQKLSLTPLEVFCSAWLYGNLYRGQYHGDSVSCSDKVKAHLNMSSKEHTHSITTFINNRCAHLANRLTRQNSEVAFFSLDCTTTERYDFSFGTEQVNLLY